MLRKLIRRIRTVAKSQFTGGTQLFETMQETMQGIRIVKAFTLEDAMRERMHDEHRRRSSTKPTRWRASPTARAR